MNKRGFTTTILHSDRSKPIEHGSLHKPIHTSVAYGYADARDLAAVFKGEQAGYLYGRQGTPTAAALEDKITAMERGIATIVFATGMAAITSVILALLRAGDHLVSSSFLFGNTNSLFNTLDQMGIAVTFVDGDRRREPERCPQAADANGVRRDDRKPSHASRRSGRDRRVMRGERHCLLRRQHDDVAVSLSAGAGLGEPDHQFADEVHWRARQRARRRCHRYRPVRLVEVSAHLR